jgi:hypothetical protein
VRSDIQEAIDKLAADGDSKESSELRQKLTEIQSRVTDNRDELAKRKPAILADLESVAQKLAEPQKKTDKQSDSSLWSWFVLPGKILAAVVVAFLLVTALMYVWKRAWRNVEINVARFVTAHVGSARNTQPDFTDKLTSLSTAQKETNNNLLDLHTEVRTLARMVRESLADRNDRRLTALPLSYPVQSDGSPQKEEPDFPISVNDYLGKMSRFANAVKLDFQNGVLVNDPEDKGELFLIRDSRLPDERQPLFVVPGAAQFHNKQDFEIYYAKYYECVRPAMGDVWIIDPAVVEKVSGGWQLREKGTLEVR